MTAPTTFSLATTKVIAWATTDLTDDEAIEILGRLTADLAELLAPVQRALQLRHPQLRIEVDL